MKISCSLLVALVDALGISLGLTAIIWGMVWCAVQCAGPTPVLALAGDLMGFFILTLMSLGFAAVIYAVVRMTKEINEFEVKRQNQYREWFQRLSASITQLSYQDTNAFNALVSINREIGAVVNGGVALSNLRAAIDRAYYAIQQCQNNTFQKLAWQIYIPYNRMYSLMTANVSITGTRIIGGGFGVKGAITGMATAAAANTLLGVWDHSDLRYKLKQIKEETTRCYIGASWCMNVLGQRCLRGLP